MFSLQELLENTQLERFTCSTRKEKCKMITKEKNRTKIICAVVTAISAIVAGGSAFQLYNVQNISQTVNGNVISVHPDYIIYACKEVLSDGKLEYHLYSGYPSSEDLVDLKGNHISRKSVLLDCLEAGETAYMDRRNSYEILNG